MANFGSSLAKFAGAGLLQYGQFKYQEQLDAMREANLAKREQARMDQADRHHKEGMTFQREQLKQQGEKVDKQLAETERQIQANAAEANRRLDLTERGLANDMDQFKVGLEYKRVEALDGAFDAAQKKYDDTISQISRVELEAGQNPDTPPDFGARVAQARAAAKAELLNTHASLFDANPEMAKKTRYWGGESYNGWLEAKDASAKALTDSLLGGGTTTPPPPSDSADTGNSRGDGTEVSRSGAEYTRYDSRDRTAPTAIGLIPTMMATQANPATTQKAASLPYFGGSKAELQALIDKSSGAQRQTLMQIMRQKF